MLEIAMFRSRSSNAWAYSCAYEKRFRSRACDVFTRIATPTFGCRRNRPDILSGSSTPEAKIPCEVIRSAMSEMGPSPRPRRFRLMRPPFSPSAPANDGIRGMRRAWPAVRSAEPPSFRAGASGTQAESSLCASTGQYVESRQSPRDFGTCPGSTASSTRDRAARYRERTRHSR